MKAETPKLHTKLRHVDINQHWLREKVQQGEFDVIYVKSGDMVADGLTKVLTPQLHENFIKQLRMSIPSSPSND